RTGTLTVAGQTVTVDQDGSANCPGSAFTLSPASRAVQPEGGGIFRVNVTGPEDCLWTATTTTPWIHITPRFETEEAPPGGEGNGSFDYTVEQNFKDDRGFR